ncbi:MAG: hypothetical protein WCK05_00360 [Planctomycetota bacterium]
MSFDYMICYENRGPMQTSRWKLEGVKTLAAGNTEGGWLWLTAARTGDVVTADVFKDAACTTGNKVASGTVNVAGIVAGAVRCVLAQANGSGISGEFYLEQYAAGTAAPVAVLVSLCVDADLAIEYGNLADLPAYSVTAGLAEYCATASRKVLLLASQLFSEELGGCGAPEHRHLGGAGREYPDYRRLANPDQLREAAVHWALMLAFGRSHERADKTMYSELRDYHDRRRQEAIGSWKLSFNTNPDGDADADQAASARAVRVTRL